MNARQEADYRGLSLLAMGATAVALAYFYDPESGRGRRARVKARLEAGLHGLGRRTGRWSRHLGADVRGFGLRLRHRVPGRVPDERTLLDRVESELFADSSMPKGKLNFDVEKGVLMIRGELPTELEIEAVERAVIGIPGVVGVESLLHLPGQPAPNKAAALSAS